MAKKKLLKGNYEPPKNPEIDKKDRIPTFEHAVTDNVGGSIATVRMPKGKKLVKEN